MNVFGWFVTLKNIRYTKKEKSVEVKQAFRSRFMALFCFVTPSTKDQRKERPVETRKLTEKGALLLCNSGKFKTREKG